MVFAASFLSAMVTFYVLSMVYKKLRSPVEQLAESRAQVQTIFDNLKEGVVVLDQGRNIVQMNEAARHLLGINSRSVPGDIVVETFEVFLPDGSPLPPERWPSELAMQGQFIQDFELKIRRKDTGRIVVAETTTAPIRNKNGDIVEVIVSYRDVTQPRELEESRLQLAAIVDSSEDAIISKDEEGIVTSWNRGAEAIFGYQAEEMIGTSIKRIIPDDRQDEEDTILNHIREGRTVEHIETIRKKKNGQFIHISLTVSPVRDAAGKIVGASKIARNITDRKRLESQLRQSQKMEAIGQLAGGISHDFNNLLAVILGNLDLLEGMEKDNEKALKRVHTAQRAALRGADLTRRLLKFSSGEELKPTVVNLNTSVHTVIDLASRVLGTDIKISLHLDESIAPIFVDAAGLESALLNLVVNARDAMPKGGALTVTTQKRPLDERFMRAEMRDLKPGNYVSVSVSDTGCGMSKEVLDRVFEPFFTTKPRGKGTGLGLSMAYGFCKQSGGMVHIYSEPDLGTTVSFYLPLGTETVEVAVGAPELSYFSSTGGVALVVDDEEDLLDVASAYFEDLGYVALTANDGPSAIELLKLRADICLLLTDVVMSGGMNGVELAQQARILRPSIKVIYCSGFPSDSLAERHMLQFDSPLLQKPYQRSQFAAVIRGVMDEHGKEHESSP